MRRIVGFSNYEGYEGFGSFTLNHEQCMCYEMQRQTHITLCNPTLIEPYWFPVFIHAYSAHLQLRYSQETAKFLNGRHLRGTVICMNKHYTLQAMWRSMEGSHSPSWIMWIPSPVCSEIKLYATATFQMNGDIIMR